MNLDTAIFKTLRDDYLRAVRDMATAQKGSRLYYDADLRAMNTSRTAFEVLGKAAADTLREEGLKEWERIRGYPIA